jgi:outer membrane protein assembly factor BamB
VECCEYECDGRHAHVSGGRVYIATTAGLQALSTTTGAALWTALPGQDFYGSPTITINPASVYIASTGGDVYSVNAATGSVNWTAPLGAASYSSPAAVGGIVYVGCSDDKLYALQALTGKIVWTYTTGASIDSAPAVVAGVVYVGSKDDSLYALNAATGALLWSYATGGQIESSPAVANGIVHVSSDDGKIYALRAVASPISGVTAGTLLWSSTGALYPSPAVAHGKVFYGYTTLYAANGRTGSTIWSFTPDTNLRGRIVVANGVVYATSASGILYALDESVGTELWHAQSGSPYLGGLSISDGIVYVTAYEVGTTSYALSAGSDIVRRHAPALSSLHPDPRLVVTR